MALLTRFIPYIKALTCLVSRKETKKQLKYSLVLVLLLLFFSQFVGKIEDEHAVFTPTKSIGIAFEHPVFYLFYQGRVISSHLGLNIAYFHNNQFYNNDSFSWNVSKTSPHQMRAIGSCEALGIQQEWWFDVAPDEVSWHITLSTQGSKPVSLERAHIDLFALPDFTEYVHSVTEKGAFGPWEEEWQEQWKEQWKNQSYETMQPIGVTGKVVGKPLWVLFENTNNALFNFTIISNTGKEDQARVLMLHTLPDQPLILQPDKPQTIRATIRTTRTAPAIEQPKKRRRKSRYSFSLLR